ncbi:peptide-methionine (S)-S-oxide reductase MsrA [Patescibacteria group bacterium]
MKLQIATFAAGCFWGVEKAFSKVKGVVSTRVGYTGGQTIKPTYEEVSSDTTGHTEAIEIKYDPSKVSYSDLLKVFWKIHDPTDITQVSTQYRSVIFTHNMEQEFEARDSKAEIEAKQKKVFHTEIVSASTFYKAEEEHQKYLQKNKSGKF